MDKIRYYKNVFVEYVFRGGISLLLIIMTAVLLFGSVIAGIGDRSMDEFLKLFACGIVLLLITMVYIYIRVLTPLRCPNCKKNFALKGCGIEELDMEQSFGNETNYSADGNIEVSNVVAYNQRVYQHNYVCKYCGQGVYKTFKGNKKRA